MRYTRHFWRSGIKELPIARPIRVEYPGAVNPVTARGNKRRKVFRDNGIYTVIESCRRHGIDRFPI
jgi:hypothetical protein